MIPSWAYLDEQDRAVFRATIAFLQKRLADHSTIEWAARLGPERRIERAAIDNLLSHPGPETLEEPWTTAWRLIEESWLEKPVEKGHSTAAYQIQARLRSGERSGTVISSLIDLVAPRLVVDPISPERMQFANTRRRPKVVRDMLSARLASGDLVDLNVLELEKLDDVRFLMALARELESAVNHGLDIGRRLGWDGERRLWQLGELYRVLLCRARSPARRN